jgi:hypothetical protein
MLGHLRPRGGAVIWFDALPFAPTFFTRLRISGLHSLASFSSSISLFNAGDTRSLLGYQIVERFAASRPASSTQPPLRNSYKAFSRKCLEFSFVFRYVFCYI